MRRLSVNGCSIFPCCKSPTWPSGQPILRQGHIGCYMRRERWFHAAWCRRGRLFYRRDVPRQSICPVIRRSRHSPHHFVARSTGGCSEWAVRGVVRPHQHGAWIPANVSGEAEGWVQRLLLFWREYGGPCFGKGQTPPGHCLRPNAASASCVQAHLSSFMMFIRTMPLIETL